MATGFEYFKRYCALKAHFNSDYDYFEHEGRIKVSRKSYEKRNDKLFFEKIARKWGGDPTELFVSNLVANKQFWAGEVILNAQAVKTYFTWKKRKDTRSYLFRQEMSAQDLSTCFKCINNNYPPLLTSYYRGDVSLETLIIAIDCARCARDWNEQLKEDIVWKELRGLIIKYKPFLNYDRERYRRILREIRDTQIS